MPKPTKTDPPKKSATLKSLAAGKTGALHPKDTVQTAGERMREHDAGAWPVAEDRTLVGMIQEKNPDWNLGGRGHDPKAARVSEIMNREVIFCFEDEPCAEAKRKMEEHGMNFLPVVDREMKIVGIFTREEVEKEAEAES